MMFTDQPKPDILYIPNFIEKTKASEYLDALTKQLPWTQGKIYIFGKWYLEPRLIAWYGEKPYTYSGKTLAPQPFHPLIYCLKNKIETSFPYTFNTALINLYRDGYDSMGWHSDDEPELGINPSIASLNFGAGRWFHFKYKKDKTTKYKIYLEHGSLLLMKGDTQHSWLHALPKTTQKIGPRINITFRLVL